MKSEYEPKCTEHWCMYEINTMVYNICSTHVPIRSIVDIYSTILPVVENSRKFKNAYFEHVYRYLGLLIILNRVSSICVV